MERGDPRENFVFHGGGGSHYLLPVTSQFQFKKFEFPGRKGWNPDPPPTPTSRSEQWSIHAYKLVCGGCMWKLLKRLMCIVIPPLSQIPGSLYPFMLCVSWKWGETIACLNCKASNIWPNKKNIWPAWIFHDRNPKGQNLWFTMFKNLEWTTNLYYKKLLLMYIRQFRNLSYDIEKKII